MSTVTEKLFKVKNKGWQLWPCISYISEVPFSWTCEPIIWQVLIRRVGPASWSRVGTMESSQHSPGQALRTPLLLWLWSPLSRADQVSGCAYLGCPSLPLSHRQMLGFRAGLPKTDSVGRRTAFSGRHSHSQGHTATQHWPRQVYTEHSGARRESDLFKFLKWLNRMNWLWPTCKGQRESSRHHSNIASKVSQGKPRTNQGTETRNVSWKLFAGNDSTFVMFFSITHLSQ